MAQKTIVLTFDDACKSHFEVAAPVLQKYGFGATFFISMPGIWLCDAPGAYMNKCEIAELYKMGFEIGNHSMNHVGFGNISDDVCRYELKMLNNFLRDAGVPEPVSFAYPGGPYAGNAVPVLKEAGLLCARTTGHDVWDLRKTDPMRIPAFSVNAQKEIVNFEKALSLTSEDPACAVVMVYHGTPDIGHPQCDTPAEMFAEHMKILAENNFRVVSMRQFMGV